MKLSSAARTRLVVINLCIWGLCAVSALVVLGSSWGAISRHLEPIGQELGGWGGLALAAAGFADASIPAYEIAIDPKVIGAVQLLPADPASESGQDSHWFPARLRSDGNLHPVWLQLVSPGPRRGLHEQVWRVRFDSGDGPRATGEVTLFPDASGNHAREAAIRETARTLGLLAPPHGFAKVSINGTRAGIYFWSQGDPAALLTQLSDPEGTGPDPDHVRFASAPGASPYSIARSSSLPWFSGRPLELGAVDRQLERLLDLTDHASDADFDRQVPQLLDVGKYLRWNALSWLLGDPGVDFGAELAWYLDPVSGLLEPIVQDWSPARSAGPSVDRLGDSSRLTARLLRDPAHRAERNQLLWDWLTRSDADVVADSERRLGESLTKLARAEVSFSRAWQLYEEAEFGRRSREALRERKSRIRRALQQAAVRTRTDPRADGTAMVAVELEPLGLAEIELSELRLELGSALSSAVGPATLRLFDPAGLERRSARVVADVAGSAVRLRPPHFGVSASADGDADLQSQPWRLEIDLSFIEASAERELQLLELAFRNAVTGEALPTARLLPVGAARAREHAELAAGEIPDVTRPVREVIRESGLPLALDGDTLVLTAGSYELARTLVVPPDFRLRLEAGVRLRLAPGVSIVAFRGLTARGTRFEPIEIRAADPERPWGVIGVARAPERSVLRFASISGGSQLRFAGLRFEGQLSFNAADFVLDDAEVSDSRGGDGLSAKRSSFSIRRTRFASNADDGFESEWSEGTVVDSVFLDNADDGLDLADSRLSIGGCDFEGMGDKPIKADERSVVTPIETGSGRSEIAIAAEIDSRIDDFEALIRRN